jgi:hypothetical protein
VKKNKFIYLSIQFNLFIFFLWTTIPLFSLILSIEFVAFTMASTYLLIFFDLFSVNKFHKFFNFFYIFLIIIFTEVFLKFANDSSSLFYIIFDFFYEAYFIVFIIYFYIKKKFFSGHIRNLYFSLILITFITSIIGLIVDPEASRFLATQDANITNPYFNSLKAKNIAGFNLVYIAPIITLFNFLREKIDVYKIIVIALTSFFVFLSNYAIALIFLLFSSVFFFIPKGFKLSKLIYLFTILIAVLIVFSNQIGDLIMNIAVLIRPLSLTLYDRFRAISDLLTGLENPHNDITRFDLYIEGLSNVIKNFPFGSIFTTRDTMNHSFILDYFSVFGIFGLFVYLLMLKRIYSILVNVLEVKPKVIILLILMSIGLSFLNPIKPIYSLMFVIPILYNKYSMRPDSSTLIN